MEEENGSVAEDEQMEHETSHKKVRHRKKQLYEAVRKQMEFYFSDANLSKDRFLGKLIVEDPCIDISVFIRFNRIRTLTTDVKDIANALRKSELLSVTEDGTKVYRTTPFQEKENTDDCTIYVEQLPPDSQHDWLREVFSAYGKVAYVSIPKYKSSGKIKGFAFVEFETPEEANKTLEAFGAMGCRLSSQIAPEKLCSIATFEPDGGKCKEMETEEVKKETVEEKEEEDDDEEESPAKIQDSVLKKKKKKKKDKLECSDIGVSEKETAEFQEESENISPIRPSKRKRSEDNDVETCVVMQESLSNVEKENNDMPPKEKKRKKNNTEKTECKEEEETKLADDNTDTNLHKKKQKRKSQDEKKASSNEDDTELQSGKKKCRIQENVLDSKENRDDAEKMSGEIEFDEECVSESKEIEDYKPFENVIEVVEGAVEGEMADEGELKKRRKRKKKHKKDKQNVEASRLQILSKKEWKRLRNKYLDLQKAKMKCLKHYLSKNRWGRNPASFQNQNQFHNSNGQPQEKEEYGEGNTEAGGKRQEADKKPRISFTPGVIAHVLLDEPINDVRKFKAEAKSIADVEYVDVLMGANEAFIRCATAAATNNFVSNAPWQQTTLLEGEEETEYWKKIFADRETKFSSNVRVKQRGRDKILRRAERELGKHIRFDD